LLLRYRDAHKLQELVILACLTLEARDSILMLELDSRIRLELPMVLLTLEHSVAEVSDSVECEIIYTYTQES